MIDTTAMRKEAENFRPFGFKATAQMLEGAANEIDRLREDRAAIEYAAHMPADYQYGLPSWINQHLYGKLIQWTARDGGPISRTEDVEQIIKLRRIGKRIIANTSLMGTYNEEELTSALNDMRDALKETQQ